MPFLSQIYSLTIVIVILNLVFSVRSRESCGTENKRNKDPLRTYSGLDIILEVKSSD